MVVLDPGLLTLVDPVEGLKPDGILIINTKKSYEEIMNSCSFSCRVGIVNADQIAKEELGRVIVNTTMLGALMKATGFSRSMISGRLCWTGSDPSWGEKEHEGPGAGLHDELTVKE